MGSTTSFKCFLFLIQNVANSKFNPLILFLLRIFIIPTPKIFFIFYNNWISLIFNSIPNSYVKYLPFLDIPIQPFPSINPII